VTSLRQARKRREREKKAHAAVSSRVREGETKAARSARMREAELRARRLEGAKRDARD